MERQVFFQKKNKQKNGKIALAEVNIFSARSCARTTLRKFNSPVFVRHTGEQMKVLLAPQSAGGAGMDCGRVKWQEEDTGENDIFFFYSSCSECLKTGRRWNDHV